MADTRCWLISGRVQGVGFRAAARREALALHLRGEARNLADGRVEVLADGSPAALHAFADWLLRGPPLARVESVHEVPADRAPGAGFEIG